MDDVVLDAVVPQDGDKDIEDAVDRVELPTDRFDHVVVYLKPGHKREEYVKAGTVGPYFRGRLADWVGDIWVLTPGYNVVEVEVD